MEACEIDAIGKIGDENVGGRCDILLKRIKNKKIENAIVDLKYAGKKHRTMMENGEDLQLAIYSKIFNKDASYCPTSYFIITSGLLFTTCKEAFTNGIILRQGSNHIDTYGHALNRIGNTIKFRREELREGKIEVGENVCKEDLAVFELAADSYILPDHQKNVKSMSAYNDYLTFIDTE